MSRPRKIIYPTSVTLTIRPQSKLYLIIGVFLFSTVLFTGCGPDQAVAQPPASPAAVPTATSTPIAVTLPVPPSTVTSEATAVSPTEVNSAGDSLPKPELAAKIGKITFAMAATEQREPINPGLLFSPGITQVHAIFDYNGMSPAYTWERVWLLNDKEVARNSGVWTGPESGVFDYFIDNNGKPLPPGDWILEIYVEGKLISLGAFVIENPAETGIDLESSQ